MGAPPCAGERGSCPTRPNGLPALYEGIDKESRGAGPCRNWPGGKGPFALTRALRRALIERRRNCSRHEFHVAVAVQPTTAVTAASAAAAASAAVLASTVVPPTLASAPASAVALASALVDEVVVESASHGVAEVSELVVDEALASTLALASTDAEVSGGEQLTSHGLGVDGGLQVTSHGLGGDGGGLQLTSHGLGTVTGGRQSVRSASAAPLSITAPSRRPSNGMRPIAPPRFLQSLFLSIFFTYGPHGLVRRTQRSNVLSGIVARRIEVRSRGSGEAMCER